MILLVTSAPDTLLATVRSRCPRLPFRPLDAVDVAKALVKMGRTETEARAIAATADGSIGVALEAAGGDLVESRDIAVRVLTDLTAGVSAASTADAEREMRSSGARLIDSAAIVNE